MSPSPRPDNEDDDATTCEQTIPINSIPYSCNAIPYSIPFKGAHVGILIIHLGDIPMEKCEALVDEVVDLKEVGRDEDVHHALNLQWLHLDLEV